MTIGESLKNFGNKLRSYSHQRENTLENDRERNSQTGYLQRENWFDRTLRHLGRSLAYAGIVATSLTGIGGIALATQYIRGGFPFKDERDNAFVITQNAITEKPARPLKQGVNLYVPPFVRTVDINSEPVKITGKIQSAETQEFMYRSKEGAQVRLKTQYNYQVTTPDGAARVFWDYGGLAKAHETLDTIVENALMNVLAKVDAKDVAKEKRTLQPNERVKTGKDYMTARGGEEIDYLLEAENEANAILEREKIGIKLTNFAISNPKYTAGVESAWEAPIRAQAIIIDEEGKARARIVRANSEAKEAEILAGATQTTMKKRYLPIAEEAVAGLNLPPEEKSRMKLQIALALQGRDNSQQIASSGQRTINVVGGGLDSVFSRDSHGSQINYGPVSVGRNNT